MNADERGWLKSLFAPVGIHRHWPAVVLLMALPGCANPFDDDYYMKLRIPPEQLRRIEMLDLNEMSKPEDAAPEPEARSIDLSLAECRALALQNNLELKVALLEPTIARQSISEEEAFYEALLFSDLTYAKTDTPTATALSGSQTESIAADAGLQIPLRTGGTITAAVPISQFETDNAFATLNPAYTADLQLSISQPLLRNAGPRTHTHAIRMARYDAQAAEARTKLEVMRIIADVDRLYWRLYAARRELEVRKQQYDLAQAQYERARRRVAAGDAAEIEVTRAESGVAERLEGIILAEGAVQERERELKRFLNKPGLPIESITIIVPTTPPNPVKYHLDARRLVDAAMARRMELLELEIQLVQDASTIDFLRNQALPVLNLDYTYGVNGLGASYGRAFEMTGNHEFVDHTIGVRAELPLGNEAARSRVRRAIYTRLSRTHSKAARQLLIREEVIDALAAINTHWQRILAAQRRTILAARTYEGEQRQNDLGLRTITDVLEAQANLADAQLAELSAVADYEIAQVDLAVATGTLLGAAQIDWEPAEPGIDTLP